MKLAENKPLKLTTLRRPADFLEIRKKGKRIVLADWVYIKLKSNSQNQLRLGLSLPKKVGNAVTRNKLRRWCKEYFRHYIKTGSPKMVDLHVHFQPHEESFYKKLSFKEFRSVFDGYFQSDL